jgi:hypothetical protein
MRGGWQGRDTRERNLPRTNGRNEYSQDEAHTGTKTVGCPDCCTRYERLVQIGRSSMGASSMGGSEVEGGHEKATQPLWAGVGSINREGGMERP